jgi:murein DD-endopeptidase MepM/ murein hydrolase activator NlpD
MATATQPTRPAGGGNGGKPMVDTSGLTWVIPCDYTVVSSAFGWRVHPIEKVEKFHNGVDLWAPGIKGKPIVAAADGIVSIATYNTGGYGYYVMVNHGTGDDGKKYVTLYAHMTKYIVKVGQYVKKGQTIGYVGTSGASTGYHLHFEIRANGNTTNPMSYY